MGNDADTVSRLERLPFPLGTSLTTRILTVNLIPLLVLAGSLFFLDSYRRQLLDERFKLARIEAQITAEALRRRDLRKGRRLCSARSGANNACGCACTMPKAISSQTVLSSTSPASLSMIR